VLQKHSRKTSSPAGGAKSRLPNDAIRLLIGLAVGALLALAAQTALAQSAADISPDHTFSTGFKFAEQSGESLYKSVCQACHMPNGQGASGAASYPSLAADPAPVDHGYPTYVVVFGKRAMPPFGDMMSNEQVAAVLNYLRTHFDNNYPDSVSAEEIEAIRH
jgi:mono/diheme cytochrome c family protein